eukprot:6479672-Amphidinium_carterae.1
MEWEAQPMHRLPGGAWLVRAPIAPVRISVPIAVGHLRCTLRIEARQSVVQPQRAPQAPRTTWATLLRAAPSGPPAKDQSVARGAFARTHLAEPALSNPLGVGASPVVSQGMVGWRESQAHAPLPARDGDVLMGDSDASADEPVTKRAKAPVAETTASVEGDLVRELRAENAELKRQLAQMSASLSQQTTLLQELRAQFGNGNAGLASAPVAPGSPQPWPEQQELDSKSGEWLAFQPREVVEWQ